MKSKLPKPWKHQRKTLTKLKRSNLLFDMSDPGTGKTRPAIHGFAHHGGRALVLAVKSNLNPVWFDEFRTWEPSIVPVVAEARNRLAAFKANHADVIITNTDAAKWIQAQGTRFFKKLGITHLIIDESTFFKNANNARSRAALWIRQQPSIEHVELMSGTPNPLSVTELWHQAMLLDLGETLGVRYHQFRQTVCKPKKIRLRASEAEKARGILQRVITTWEDIEGVEEAVFGLLSKYSIRHKFEECTDIPSNTVHYLDINLPPKLQAEYDQLEKDSILRAKTENIVGVNKAVVHTKLLQLCSGAVYMKPDEEKSRYEVFDSSRYELIADLVAERPWQSISFFNWRHQRDCVREHLEKKKISHAWLDGTVNRRGERDRIVGEFQAGKIRHLLIHPRTGAHGLTLTAGKTVIWSSPVPQPDLFKQGVHRVHRGGQTEKTETICIRALNTREEDTYEVMTGRKKRMDNFLDLVAMGE